MFMGRTSLIFRDTLLVAAIDAHGINRLLLSETRSAEIGGFPPVNYSNGFSDNAPMLSEIQKMRDFIVGVLPLLSGVRMI
jgi:hypothetical protein